MENFDITPEETNANLSIWNKVCTTPKDKIKPVKLGGRSFSSISPQWQIKVATALFGPYGKDWGMKDIAYEYMKLERPVKEYDSNASKYITTGREERMCCFLTATFYYPLGEFTLSNDMEVEAGDDHRKKLLTDLTTKALSKLGFSADVFLGMHDAKY